MAIIRIFQDKNGRFVSPNLPQFHVWRTIRNTAIKKTHTVRLSDIRQRKRKRETRQLTFDSDLKLDKSPANITDILVSFRVDLEEYTGIDERNGKSVTRPAKENVQWKHGYKLSAPITKAQEESYFEKGGLLYNDIVDDIKKTPHATFRRIEFHEPKFLKYGKKIFV